MVRRRFVLPVAAVIVAIAGLNRPAVVAQDAVAYEVSEKSISELQVAMADGRVTSAQLVELYLQRIRAYDQAGPRLNAVLYVNPTAARDAVVP